MEPVQLDIALPPFCRAYRDGYAVRSSDVGHAPATLRTIGEIVAGEAIRIFTGTPIPRVADAVQKVEITKNDVYSVIIEEAVRPGQFITPRASEVAAGETITEPGCEIGPVRMAELASLGYSQVRVGTRPCVAVTSTGSGLVDVPEKPAGAQIRNSNSNTIASDARRADAIVDLARHNGSHAPNMEMTVTGRTFDT